jgi:hypothetical protein
MHRYSEYTDASEVELGPARCEPAFLRRDRGFGRDLSSGPTDVVGQ